MQSSDDRSKPGDEGGSPSLLARLLGRTTQIDRKEMPAVIASFLLIFCVMCGYFAVRSVRETAGTVLGKDRVANLFLITWVASHRDRPRLRVGCRSFPALEISAGHLRGRGRIVWPLSALH